MHPNATVRSGEEIASRSADCERVVLACGVSRYLNFRPLLLAGRDAKAIAKLFERDCACEVNLLLDDRVKRSRLRQELQQLFGTPAATCIFYFSGHGIRSGDSGMLATHDGEQHDEGISFRDLAAWMRRSPARQILVVLDCCHAGAVEIPWGELWSSSDAANFEHLGKGRVLLAACSGDRQSSEDTRARHGLFTDLFLRACQGEAANDRGEVTVAAAYRYISSQLGTRQMPVWKGEMAGDMVLLQLASPAPRTRVPLKQRIVHPLAIAPRFAGRRRESWQLQDFILRKAGVFALIGIGGSGKTAIAQRVLEKLLAIEPPVLDAVFAWSFYDDRNASYFLREADLFFSASQAGDRAGVQLVESLLEAISSGGRYLLVLDGLEVLQKNQTDARGVFGAIEDRLLARFLASLAARPGRAKCVITSRFEIADLHPWRDRGYWSLPVPDLDLASAKCLLKACGVRGSERELERAIAEYSSHSLTLDRLGRYIAEFCQGDLRSVRQLPEPNLHGGTKVERQLARVLYAYRDRLSRAELEFMAYLCAFRLGTNFDTLCAIALSKASENQTKFERRSAEQIIERLVELGLLGRSGDRQLWVHPAVRDFFYRSCTNPLAVHNAIRQHFSRLVDRPDTELPTCKSALDLLEELIYHSLKVGDANTAADLYQFRLGGVKHLGWHLGEFDRGQRLLRLFLAHCSCLSRRILRDMGIYLRALGDLDLALKCLETDAFRGSIYLLQGNLPAVAKIASFVPEYVPVKEAIAHLQGERVESVAVVTATTVLFASEPRYFLGKIESVDLQRARRHWRDRGWSDDVSRAELILAEIARLQGKSDRARELADRAERWIVRSNSQEHLAVFYYLNGKLAGERGDRETARIANSKAIEIARECGFGLYLVDFLNGAAQLSLASGDYVASEQIAAEAFELANVPQLKSVWAAATALHVRGEALGYLQRSAEAISALKMALALRQQIGDPQQVVTQTLLTQIDF